MITGVGSFVGVAVLTVNYCRVGITIDSSFVALTTVEEGTSSKVFPVHDANKYIMQIHKISRNRFM
jgi:hypothetical protein